eukprot:ANDGO_02934.mRNA.1 Ultraviolet-B receptor UVR8
MSLLKKALKGAAEHTAAATTASGSSPLSKRSETVSSSASVVQRPAVASSSATPTSTSPSASATLAASASGSGGAKKLWQKARTAAKTTAILSDAALVPGKIYSWGLSDFGQLGHGSRENLHTPRVIDDMRGLIIRHLSVGSKHCVVVSENGDLFSFGLNEYGQLGDGTVQAAMRPVHVGEKLGKKFVQAACGEIHSLALTDSGQVYAWGGSSLGQLGLGDTGNQLSPRLVEPLSHVFITSICAGSGHSAAISDDGRVYIWGWGEHGQLGLGDLGNQLTPRWIEYLQGKNVRAVACGEAHTMALTESGELFSWGNGEDGRLGHTAYGKSLFPGLVQSAFGRARVSAVACGDEFSVAVTETGEVWSWGRGLEGQLGTGAIRNETLPVLIAGLKEQFITNVCCGYKHAMAVTDKGAVYSWGLNLNSQLGIGASKDEYRDTPQLLKSLEGKCMRLISAGGDSSVVVAGGSIVLPTNLFSAGDGSAGALGLESMETEQVLQPVSSLDGNKISYAAAGVAHSVVVMEDGTVYSCGRNDAGALGIGIKPNADERGQESILPSPQLIQEFVSKKKVILRIACGAGHTLCLSSTANVFGFGYNFNGELGLGHRDHVASPELIRHLEGRGVMDVQCGWNSSAAVTDTGDVYTWGSNGFGQLGHDSTNDENLPRLVKSIVSKQIVAVSCGRCHMAAISSDGVAYTWGLNNNGQLGHGDTTICLTPRVVSGFVGRKVVAVACGSSHTCMILDTGELYTWGYGNSGRLGHGDSKDALEPRLLDGFASRRITKVFSSSVAFHTFAVDEDGTLYGWGAGKHGQLSSAKFENEKVPIPIRVLGTMQITHVACGAKHSCVVTKPSLRFERFRFDSIPSGSSSSSSSALSDSKRAKSPGSMSVRSRATTPERGGAGNLSSRGPGLSSAAEISSLVQKEHQKDTEMLRDQLDRMKLRNAELREEIEGLRVSNLHLSGAKVDDLQLDALDQLKEQFMRNFGKIESAKEAIIKTDMKDKEKAQLQEMERIYTEILKRAKTKEKHVQEALLKLRDVTRSLEEKIRILREEVANIQEQNRHVQLLRDEIQADSARCSAVEDHQQFLTALESQLRDKIASEQNANTYLSRRYETLLSEYEQLREEVEVATGKYRHDKSLVFYPSVERLLLLSLPELEELEKRHVQAYLAAATAPTP